MQLAFNLRGQELPLGHSFGPGGTQAVTFMGMVWGKHLLISTWGEAIFQTPFETGTLQDQQQESLKEKSPSTMWDL